jgi:hypothetical protein
MALSLERFAQDPHAATYVAELRRRRQATEQLFTILNDAANEQRLQDAESLGKPALAGVVRFLESEPAIEAVLLEGDGSRRFRQAVGVAVRLKMQELGWSTSGRKGSVSGASHFKKAERYEPSGS